MNPIDHLIQLAKSGNQGALASLKALAQGGNQAAVTALSTMGDENGSTGEEPEGAYEMGKSQGEFDVDALRKSLGELLDDVPGADGEGDDLSKSEDGDDEEAPAGDDDGGDNLEFDFENFEDDQVAKSLAGLESRLDRLTKGTVGTGYGLLDAVDRLEKSQAGLERVEAKLDTLLKALKQPAAPAGVVQPGTKPAGKPIGGLAKGKPAQSPETLRKSLQAKQDAAEPGSAEWLDAYEALQDLSVGRMDKAQTLLGQAAN
ncbi:MAG: hypothetical protein KC613_06625 [Myxococcales bacterium]|nr:hypothetical protein [Myxococcales bacterium]